MSKFDAAASEPTGIAGAMEYRPRDRGVAECRQCGVSLDGVTPYAGGTEKGVGIILFCSKTCLSIWETRKE